jgi:hypothetical protein
MIMPLFPEIWKRRKVFAALGFLLIVSAPLEGATISHFPSPAVTAVWSEFYGTIRIDGVDAQPGDEIAFYDPAGILCGSHVIQQAGEYGIVHVYGDDTATPDVDEGASPEEILSVRIWDSRRQVELSGGTLRLSGGIPLAGSYFSSSPVPPIWQDQTGYVLNLDTTSHFPKPTPTPQVSNYAGSLSILGSPAAVGDEVAVFDPNGVLCGHFRVNQPGQFGMIQIYGDDTTTPEDEGAVAGDLLTFKVWQRSTDTEYTGNALSLTSGEAQSSFVPSLLPPRWQPDTGYILNIAVGTFTNRAPVAADGAVQTSANTAVTGTLAATDPDGDPMTFRIVTGGSKGTVTITNAATGAFSYLPHTNQSGADAFTFVANDGTADSDAATVNVTITAIIIPNRPPVAANKRAVTTANTPVNLTVSAYDPDGDPLTYRLGSTNPRTIIRVYFNGSLPNVHAEFSRFIKQGHLGLLIVTESATGEFQYTPDPDVSGTDFFIFDAFDGIDHSKPAFIIVTIHKSLNGDINGDGFIDLADAIRALQFTTAITNLDGLDHTRADVDGDGKIGLPEAIYILQCIASLR